MQHELASDPPKTATNCKRGSPVEGEDFSKQEDFAQFTSSDPSFNLRQWRNTANDHLHQSGDMISEQLKKSLYRNKIAPHDMKQHQMLHQQWWDINGTVLRGYVAQVQGGQGETAPEGKCMRDLGTNFSQESKNVCEATLGQAQTRNRALTERRRQNHRESNARQGRR